MKHLEAAAQAPGAPRPLAVRISVALCWTLLALGWATALLEDATRGRLSWGSVGWTLLLFGPLALLAYALGRGQAWARMALLMVVAALLYLLRPAAMGASPADLMVTAAIAAAAVLSVAVLFFGAGGAWFRAAAAGPWAWLRSVVLATAYLLASWFGLVMASFVNEPWVSVLAQTTRIYPLLPDPVVGAFLRYGPYDPNGEMLGGHQSLLDAACVSYGFEEAERTRSLRAVQLLVARGADVNSVSRGFTPLHSAIITLPEDGDPAMVRTLLELGADPSIRIQRMDSRWKGLDALGLARELDRKPSRNMARVLALLSAVRSRQ